MDFRGILSYYFKTEQDTEITSKMSDEWEKLCAEIDNQNNEIGVDLIKKRRIEIRSIYSYSITKYTNK